MGEPQRIAALRPLRTVRATLVALPASRNPLAAPGRHVDHTAPILAHHPEKGIYVFQPSEGMAAS
jgi:hypothetical protein